MGDKDEKLNTGETEKLKPKPKPETPQEKQYIHPWIETGIRTIAGAMNLICSRCGLSATSDTKDRQDELACKSNRRR